MELGFHLIPLIVSSLLSAVLLIWVYFQSYSVTKKPFLLLLSSVLVYSWAYTLELLVPELNWHLFWLRIQYFGITAMPVLLLWFVLVMTGKERELSPVSVVIISLPSLVVLGLVLFIEQHDLFYRDIRLITQGSLVTISFEKGVVYWIWIVYQNLLYLLSLVILLLSAVKSSRKERISLLFITLGLLPPLIGHLIYQSTTLPFNIDIAPFLISISVLIFFISLNNYSFLNIIPHAKLKIFDLMQDMAFAINSDKRVICLNRNTKKNFNLNTNVTGKFFDDLLRQVARNRKGKLIINDDSDFERIIKTVNEAIVALKKGTFESASIQTVFTEKSDDVDSLGDKYYEFTVSSILEDDPYWTDKSRKFSQKNREGEVDKSLGLLLTFHEITDLKRSEDRVLLLAKAMESIHEGVLITDKDGTILYVNPSLEFTTGYTKKELIGKNPRILKSGVHDRSFYEEMWGSLSKGTVWVGEVINKTKSGSVYTEETSITPIFNENEEITHYIAVKRDISDKQFFQEEIDKLISALEQLDEVLIIFDTEGEIEYVNSAFERISGYKREQVIGKSFFDFRDNTSRSDLMAEIKTHIHQGMEWDGIYTIKTKSGEDYLIESKIRPVYSRSGLISNFAVIEQDITDRVKKEEKLRESEEKYRAIAETAFVGIGIHNTDYRVTYLNQALASMIGYRREDVLGRNLQEIISEDLYSKITQDFNTVSKIEGRSFESSLVTGKGDTINVLVSLTPLVSIKNEILGYITILIDVTEKQKAIESIKEIARERSNFVSMVSHELKIPLTVIKEGVSLISEGVAGEVNEEQSELLENVLTNVARLSRLINEVLEFQKLESGKVQINFVEENINKLIVETVDSLKPIVTKKGLYIKHILDESLPLVTMDPDKIVQVLVNIIGNSIKYTEKGGITIISRLSEHEKAIEISIRDTGSGIDMPVQEKVFDGFFAVLAKTQYKTGGTGLGLPISKRLIELHHGSIRIESEPSKGTTVTFSLPLAEQLS